MNVAKNEIMDLLADMPNEFDTEELMYKLFIFDKLKNAEYDISENNLIANSEITKMVQTWLSK
jgi:hypothetical protein